MYFQRILLLLLFIFSFISCAAHRSIVLPVHEYQEEMKGEMFYPANIELSRYINNQYCSNCLNVDIGYVLDVFRRSGLFYDVSIASPFTPYMIRLKFNVKNNEGDASLASKAFISGGTLGIVPLITDQTFQLAAEVRFEHELVKTYAYSVNNRNVMNITNFSEAAKIQEHSLEILLNDFFKDFIKDKIVPAAKKEDLLKKKEELGI